LWRIFGSAVMTIEMSSTDHRVAGEDDRQHRGCSRKWSQLLRSGSDEDLVERHPARPGDGKGDDLGHVLGTDSHLAVELLDAPLGLCMSDVVSSVAAAPGSMTITRMSGCSSWRSASDQPPRPHLVAL
jgi:hypothetical protein